jgi:branched-chain amino acid aminotransferase
MSEQCFIWVNGVVAAGDAAVLRGDDRGFTVAMGVFETLLANGGRLWMAERHHARLAAGAARLGIAVPGLPELLDASAAILLANGLLTSRARVRWTLSAGSPDGESTVVVSAVAAGEPRAALSLWRVPFTRNERGALAGIKASAYAENLVAQAEARRHGADEALLFNNRGEVCECATSNLFVVGDGQVRTPWLASGCLPGVTRTVVLAIAADHRLAVEEAEVLPAELDAATELFVTSSVHGIVPVHALNGRALAAAPGPWTRRLAGLLETTR